MVLQANSFEVYEEVNNSFTSITCEAHAPLSLSFNIIRNIDLNWNLERNLISSHLIDNIDILYYKSMSIFKYHISNTNFEYERKNEAI